ncbi:unnamed protein product [Paramecium pentaurelia]|uniref:Uncharacterized protein n=1 Tax=Paramecium pentaurelia TaxID=43138 RepID=A0A8S1WJV9_9CILI|nr:unnamed protein product [Paramecium pentaurelia]
MEANEVVGSLESMYNALVIKNYYLPEFNSLAITCEYLLNVALNKCFRIKISQIKIGQILKKVPKLKLFQELDMKLQGKKINIGFTIDKLPDKKWLINVLHTLDQNNEVFKYFVEHDKVIGLTKDDLEQLKQYDTFIGRKKILNFQENPLIGC